MEPSHTPEFFRNPGRLSASVTLTAPFFCIASAGWDTVLAFAFAFWLLGFGGGGGGGPGPGATPDTALPEPPDPEP